MIIDYMVFMEHLDFWVIYNQNINKVAKSKEKETPGFPGLLIGDTNVKWKWLLFWQLNGMR